jgi:hypothetical protein
VLDWTSRPEFTSELRQLLRPLDIATDSTSMWMPRGHDASTEARLESFGPIAYPDSPVWPKLEAWWLKHARGANTPNWDLAMSCRIDGKPGLVLVEAKANVPELSAAGKLVAEDASERSHENHEHIGAAIAEASNALGGESAGVRLSRDHSYQLSNRLAFAWRLASWGMPVVLVYLGFTGDQNIADVGEPLRDDEHWQELFTSHLAQIAPPQWVNQSIATEGAPFWLLARSMSVASLG